MSDIPDIVIGGKLIIRPVKSKEEKIGKLVIPATANADLAKGVVFMADPALSNILVSGDTVIHPAGAGQGDLFSGEPHIWLQIGEIWGIIKAKKDEQPV